MTNIRAHELPHLLLASSRLAELRTVKWVRRGLLLIVAIQVLDLCKVESGASALAERCLCHRFLLGVSLIVLVLVLDGDLLSVLLFVRGVLTEEIW